MHSVRGGSPPRRRVFLLAGEDPKAKPKPVSREGFVALLGPSMPADVLESCPASDTLTLPGATKGVLAWIASSVEAGEPQPMPPKGGVRAGVLRFGHMVGSERLTDAALASLPSHAVAELLGGAEAPSVTAWIGRNFFRLRKDATGWARLSSPRCMAAMREAVLSLSDLEPVASVAGALVSRLGDPFLRDLEARHPNHPVTSVLASWAQKPTDAAVHPRLLVDTIEAGGSTGQAMALLGAGVSACAERVTSSLEQDAWVSRRTTALFEAVRVGRREVVAQLLDLGADPRRGLELSSWTDGPREARSEYVSTSPRACAEQLGRRDLVELLDCAPRSAR